MTEQLVREAVIIGLENLEEAPEGMSRERKAEVILASILTALRLEARMAKASEEPAPKAPPKPSGRVPVPEIGAEGSMVVLADSVTPPKVRDGARLIAMPGDPDAAEPVLTQDKPKFQPAIRVSSLKKGQRTGGENWKIEDLVAYLHANTPTTLRVTPTGLRTEIELERNIIAAAPAGMVKVYFTLHGMSTDRAGLMGHPEDRAVLATVIGRFVFHNFMVTDPLELDIAGAMREMTERAKDVFKRRTRELQSQTPYKPGGHLRIEVGDNGRVIDNSPIPTGETYVMDLEQRE
jgi:hypothetical protein